PLVGNIVVRNGRRDPKLNVRVLEVYSQRMNGEPTGVRGVIGSTGLLNAPENRNPSRHAGTTTGRGYGEKHHCDREEEGLHNFTSCTRQEPNDDNEISDTDRHKLALLWPPVHSQLPRAV